MLTECVDIFFVVEQWNREQAMCTRTRWKWIFSLYGEGRGTKVSQKKRETISLKACNVRNNCENNAIYKSFYGFYFFKAISPLHCD